MNRLLNIISNDLSIARYSGEADADFIYRVCYSAVALWMLTMTLSCIDGRIGISKQLQAINIEGLLLQYERNLGLNPSCFSNYGNKLHSFPHLIRKVYEETGYLFSDERNYSIAANYGRTIYTGDGHLFFGIPESSCWMNGLGLYCPSGMNSVDLFDAMLRDTLSVEQYMIGLNWVSISLLHLSWQLSIIRTKVNPSVMICAAYSRVENYILNRGSNLSVRIILNEKKFLRRLKRPMESSILRSKVLSMKRKITSISFTTPTAILFPICKTSSWFLARHEMMNKSRSCRL